MLRRAYCLLGIVFLLAVRVEAQRMDTGLYAFGTFDSKGFDTVNVGNLNVHYEIPIVSKPGRNGLNFIYSLVYDGLVWSNVNVNWNFSWNPDPNFGFHGQLEGAVTGTLTYAAGPYTCQDGSSVTEFYDYTYVDATGQPHVFNLVQGAYCDDGTNGNSGDGSSTDSSGYSYDPPYVEKGNVHILPYTTTATNGAYPSLTDSNGNTVTNNGDGTFTDTTGTTELTIVGQGTPASPRTFTYPVAEQADGAMQATATSYYKAYTVQTNFGCSGISEYGPVTTNLVDHVILADGSTYYFTYESTPGVSGAVTGRLTTVTLPTTGVITYTYSGTGCGNGINSDGTPVTLQRAIASGTTTPSGTKTYTRNENVMRSTGGSYQPWVLCSTQANYYNFDSCSENTVVDEVGNETDYTFAEGGIALYETSRTVWNGTAAAGQQLESRVATFNGGPPVPFQNQPAASAFGGPPFSSIQVADSFNGIATANTLSTYDPAGSITSATVSDPESGGSVLQTTTWVYDANETLAGFGVGDGTNGLYGMGWGFDQTTPTATNGIPQHGGVTGYRGNKTSVSYSVLGTTLIGSTITHNDTGAVTATTTPTTYTTPITTPTGVTSYTLDPTQTFTTGTALPVPNSGVQISTSAAFDAASGVQTSATGANPGQTVTYGQYDRLLRPTQVSTADGGQVTMTYSPAEATSVTKMNATQSAIQETFMDTYGRVVRQAVRGDLPSVSAPVWYLKDYCYDAAGRLQYQSTPYSSGSDTPSSYQCNTSVADAYQYDGLNRKTEINHPDGSHVSLRYNGKAVKSTKLGASAVSRITQYDAVGRMITVCELSTNSSMPNSSSPTPCPADIAGTGFTTYYYYGVYSELYGTLTGLPTTTVSQGSQDRFFQTDGLGRPVQSQEPETGLTTYSYAYNSAGLSTVTRTRQQVNTPFYQTSTGAIPTTTTTTTYDALGRVVSVSYSDGTPSKSFTYDKASTGDAVQNKGAIIGQMADAFTTLNGSQIAAREFSYDVMGRVNETRDCLPDWCGQSANDVYRQYGYDTASELVTEQYGTAGNNQTTSALSYAYSLAGQLASIQGGQNNATLTPGLYATQSMGPSGPTLVQYGNGLNGPYQYDAAGQMSGNWVCRGDTQPSCPAGTQLYGEVNATMAHQLTSMVDTTVDEGGGAYYDEFGRLTGFQWYFGANTTSLGFAYDRYGNRTQQNVTGGSGPSPQLNFNVANNQVTGYTYDFAGNVINDGFHQYKYDAENNLISVDNGSTATYVYDALNQRVKAVANGVVERYGFDLSGRRATTWQDGTGALESAQYYAGSNRLAYWLAADGNIHFEHQDWLGTERVRTSATGAVESSHVSLPFGDNLTTTGPDTNPGHFAQMDHDLSATSGLEHGTFREYHATSGRWMSPDPYSGSYNWSNPQSMNRYTYALNNPFVMVDPLGLQQCNPSNAKGTAPAGPGDKGQSDANGSDGDRRYLIDAGGDDYGLGDQTVSHPEGTCNASGEVAADRAPPRTLHHRNHNLTPHPHPHPLSRAAITTGAGGRVRRSGHHLTHDHNGRTIATTGVISARDVVGHP
jgi:RHS repeat-associated protein